MSKIAVVSAYTKNIESLVKDLSRNKQEYAAAHNYRFFLDIVDCDVNGWVCDNGKTGGYYRFEYILRLMIEHPEIELFCWLDNDAFFTNFTIKLESFQNYLENDWDFIVGEDWNGVNTGVFLIKNNINTQNFIRKVMDFKPSDLDGRPYWWVKSEQCAVTSLAHTIKTILLPHYSINSYLIQPRRDNDWRWAGLGPININKQWDIRVFQSGDFILHLVGTPNEEKPKLIEQYLKEVVR